MGGVRSIAGREIRITDLGAKAENTTPAAVDAAAIKPHARELIPEPSEAMPGLDHRGRVLIALGAAVLLLGLLLSVALGSTLRSSERSRSAVTLVRRSVPEHAPKLEKWPILV